MLCEVANLQTNLNLYVSTILKMTLTKFYDRKVCSVEVILRTNLQIIRQVYYVQK